MWRTNTLYTPWYSSCLTSIVPRPFSSRAVEISISAFFRTLNRQKLHYPWYESLEKLRRARWKIDCCNFCLRMNASYRIPDQDLSIGHSRRPSSPGVIQNCYKSHHLCSLIRVLCHCLRNLFGCLRCWYEVLFWCPSSWDGLFAFFRFPRFWFCPRFLDF